MTLEYELQEITAAPWPGSDFHRAAGAKSSRGKKDKRPINRAGAIVETSRTSELRCYYIIIATSAALRGMVDRYETMRSINREARVDRIIAAM
jgi:hypothetical protein